MWVDVGGWSWRSCGGHGSRNTSKFCVTYYVTLRHITDHSKAIPVMCTLASQPTTTNSHQPQHIFPIYISTLMYEMVHMQVHTSFFLSLRPTSLLLISSSAPSSVLAVLCFPGSAAQNPLTSHGHHQPRERMIPSLHNSGLRRRQNTLTELDEDLEENKPLISTHFATVDESHITPATPPSTLLLSEEEPIVPTSLTFEDKEAASPGTCSTASLCSVSSSLSTREYCQRLHPTLLQHYYDLSNMVNTSLKSEGKLPLPQLAFQEIVLGEIIGRGGFSFVHEIRDVRLQEIYDTGNDEAASRAEFAASFKDNKSSNSLEIASSSTTAPGGTKKAASPYVLKTLRPDLPEDEHNKGIIDLAVEAQFLTSLSHPHILSLRASSNSDPLEAKYFVILDRLVSTLDHKLKIWRRDVGINMGYWLGGCIGYCCARVHVLHRIWMERFKVARDVASALEYLHGQNIVYRDLVRVLICAHLVFLFECVCSSADAIM